MTKEPASSSDGKWLNKPSAAIVGCRCVKGQHRLPLFSREPRKAALSAWLPDPPVEQSTDCYCRGACKPYPKVARDGALGPPMMLAY